MAVTIYALLVGINDYPVCPLDGCENDVNAMAEYLQQNYTSSAGFNLQMCVLTNEKASRDNIIDRFKQHFANLRDGDTALFYYSGHGDSFNKPESIYDPDGKGQLQSLVAWFEPGQRQDIADKELGSLVYEITHDKDVHFVAITDCCHSGTLMRNDEAICRAFDNKEWLDKENETQERKATGVKLERYMHLDGQPENYYGIDKAEKNANNEYVFKTGKFLHIAACQDNEKALETNFKKQRRGVFTYNLVKLLNKNKGAISYASLERQSAVMVSIASELTQHTLLNNFTGNPNAPQMQFLSDVPTGLANDAILYNEDGQWRINRGLLYDIHIGDKIILQVRGDARGDAFVTEVFPEYAAVEIETTRINNLSEQDNIPVIIEAEDKPFMEVSFAAAFPEEIKGMIKALPLFNRQPYYTITEETGSSYVIKAENGQTGFYHNAMNQPVIGPLPAEDAQKLLTGICKYSKAMYVWQLADTPGAPAIREMMAVHVYVKDSGENGFRKIENTSLPIKLTFNKNSPRPQYKVKVVNKGNDTLFVNTLYIDCLYGIDNNVFNSMPVGRGEEKWLQLAVPAGPDASIAPIYFPGNVVAKGITPLFEQCKIIVTAGAITNFAGLTQTHIDSGVATPHFGVRGIGDEWAVENLVFEVGV